jgi:hypothetical protein
MAIESKKILAAAPAGKPSVLEKFFKEKPQDEPSGNAAKQTCIPCDVPIYNIRWYPSSKSCVKISNSRKPQNTPPLMVRKAEWRR